MRLAALAALVVPLLAATSCLAAPPLETEEQKTAYAIGIWFGRNLEVFELTPEEYERFLAGLADRRNGVPSAVEMDVYEQKIAEMGRSRTAKRIDAEKAAGRAFADEEAAKPGAERFESGLVYRELEAGEGKHPTNLSTVKIHYEGRLVNGTVFDSSRETGEPHLFTLNRVIPCWTEGIQHMQVGTRAVLICPPEIAYKDDGFSDKIPPGATLRFEVELLEFDDPLADQPGGAVAPEGDHAG